MNQRKITRREFTILGAAACAGCTAFVAAASAAKTRTVDAGPADKFAADGVYDAFSREGFFLVRRSGKLLALSSFCTHRMARLKAEPDHTFYCPSHGSDFSPEGRVAHGPAKRDLPVFATSIGENGHLLVTVIR